MTVEYTAAPEAEAIASQLIAKHHPHLKGERIVYVFRSQAAVEGGKVVLGKARKISGLNAFLAAEEYDGPEELDTHGAPFFVIELAGDIWRSMPDKARRALIDHELCHCALKDDGTPKLLPHDVEEFAAVIERHGLWRNDVRAFTEIAQTKLGQGVLNWEHDN